MSKFYKNVLRKFEWPSAPEYNVLILGLDNAGKSSLVERLSSENEESVRLWKYVSSVTYLFMYFCKVTVRQSDSWLNREAYNDWK